MAKHQPRISQCKKCVNITNDCSKLEFKRMPTISRTIRESGIVIVNCTEFKSGIEIDSKNS